VTASEHVFITPPFDGPPTGGTLYDARLVAALVCAGASVTCCRGLEDGSRALREGRPGAFWVDSLFLDEFAGLANSATPRQSLGLLGHYLPSLVARGDAWRPSDLTRSEAASLHAANRIVVPSPWLAGVFESAGVEKSRIFAVEPGVPEDTPTAAVLTREAAPFTALLVGNVVPGKGVAPFLEALAAEVGSVPAPFTLVIVGSLEQDPDYAARCRATVRMHPSLQGAVVFASSMPPAEALRAIAQAHVFVSASHMESYGMALAEARAIGVPILARRGGNTSAHVEASAGGELFEDERALAAGLVRLSRDGDALGQRRALALGGVRRRTWKDAAFHFLRVTSSMP
jgi:glycosyltransferase involved in cell wall biosynthesis